MAAINNIYTFHAEISFKSTGWQSNLNAMVQHYVKFVICENICYKAWNFIQYFPTSLKQFSNFSGIKIEKQD